MKSFLIDFEDALISKTGIPISIAIDAENICKAGCKIFLWVSQTRQISPVQDWINQTFSESEKKFVQVEPSRPTNFKIWIAQLFNIRLKIPEVDFVYVRLFPGIRFSTSARRIIRVDDPFIDSPNRLALLLKFFLKPKIVIAKLLRDSAFRKVHSDSFLVPNSNYTYNKFKSLYKSVFNGRVIYPPVQFSQTVESVLNANYRELLTPFFLFIGGQRQRKDPAQIINFWAKSSYLTRYSFYVLGDIPTDILTTESKLAVQSGKLKFVKNITSNELMKLILRSSGVVFNSHGEGFGNPIAEALSSGRPIICNDLAVFREVAGEFGFIFPTNDTNMALELLQNIVTNKSHFSSESISKRINYSKRFSKENATDEWKEIVETLCEA